MGSSRRWQKAVRCSSQRRAVRCWRCRPATGLPGGACRTRASHRRRPVAPRDRTLQACKQRRIQANTTPPARPPLPHNSVSHVRANIRSPTMLAAHTDQENLVASHQQAAAAKPLNAGTRAFGAKTPAHKAPKTPFKIPLNDENGATRAGKTAGKGAENQLLPTGKKGGKADSNAFVTPAGGSRDSPRDDCEAQADMRVQVPVCAPHWA